MTEKHGNKTGVLLRLLRYLLQYWPLILLAVQWLCLWLTERDNRKKGQSEKIMRLVQWLIPVISLFGCGSIYAAAL